MKKLIRFATWLGSDWRLPLTIGVIVAVTFFVSGFGPGIIESSHKAWLKRQHDEGMARMRNKFRDWPPGDAKAKAPQLAGREVSPEFGL